MSEHQMDADFQSKTELGFLVCLLPLWCLILSKYSGADRPLVFILNRSSSKADLLEQAGSGVLSLGLGGGIHPGPQGAGVCTEEQMESSESH